MGATFDLTELQRSAGQPSYKIEDGDIPCTPNVESNYTYSFNVCGAVTGYVEEECSINLGDKLRTAGALQVNKRGTENELDDWCFVVGYYNQEQTSVHLLDPNDPTEGIMVSYNGDYCNGGKQRKFNIELQCTDKLNPVPTHAYELSGCEYTVYMPSVYGCPLECPVANRALCGGQGHCAYDNDKKGARCYCNHGYSGDDCTADGAAADEQLNYSPALLGLIITLFIIVALLVMGVFTMIKQVSAYRDDVANYQVLKGGDEDGGSAGNTPHRGGSGGGAGASSSSGDFLDTISDVLSPIGDMASSLGDKATTFLGNRAAARNAAANAMARQGQAQFNSMDMSRDDRQGGMGNVGQRGDSSSVTL
eukprot:GSChrysophyteH2.ASY1.ANO1.1628.1 assembled CDS